MPGRGILERDPLNYVSRKKGAEHEDLHHPQRHQPEQGQWA